MNQTLKTKFQNKTSIGKNSELGKESLFLIPPNTVVFTKEMTKKLEIEQRKIQKALERYNGWINQSRFFLVDFLHKINKGLKKIRIILKYNKTTQSIIFNKWTL